MLQYNAQEAHLRVWRMNGDEWGLMHRFKQLHQKIIHPHADQLITIPYSPIRPCHFNTSIATFYQWQMYVEWFSKAVSQIFGFVTDCGQEPKTNF